MVYFKYKGYIIISKQANVNENKNPLRWYGKEHDLLSNDRHERFKPHRKNICCPTNLLRTVAAYANYFYSVDEKAFWVHHYGANTFKGCLPDGANMALTQQTDYPWDGHVRITLDDLQEREMDIVLRIPGWAKGASVKVNGETPEAEVVPGTYVRLSGVWKTGDVIELDLPMYVRFMTCNPKAENNENHIAVMRGPVLYCLESADLPGNVRVSDVYVPRGTRFEVKYEKELLKGVNVLLGDLKVIRHGSWAGKLYEELNEIEMTTKKIHLVPYFAWCNRGIGEMAVWLQLL